MWRASRESRRFLLAFGLFILAASLFAIRADAQPAVSVEVYEARHAGEFLVPINKSQVLRTDQPYSDLSIGNPDIADVLPLTNRTIYVLGKAIGTTNLLIYGPERALLAVVDVVVTYDIEGLKARLFELMPEEKIEVRPAGDSITLSGLLSKADRLSQAVEIAERAAPGHVVNLMAVEGSQQVMLAVRFAELKRSFAKELGINAATGTLRFGGSLNFAISTGIGLLTGPAFGTAELLGGLGGRDFGIDPFSFDFLEEKNLGKILAEPNLLAMSGETASFLAGGEFPIPVAQAGAAVGGITVEFKQFGVGLAFTPTILDGDRINIIVAPEVSAIDRTTEVTTVEGGAPVPGLTVRRAKTTIELGNGQTFAIAGLLQNDISNNISQFPWLGDIPILGILFRSSAFQRDETELVIFVTPYIVQAGPAGAARAPTDAFIPPSDIDLFLFGRLEAPGSGMVQQGASGPLGAEGAGGIDGAHGYIVK